MKANDYTESAVACRAALVDLWGALIFCGIRPPYTSGGPEQWIKSDSDRVQLSGALAILELSEGLQCRFDTPWRTYLRAYRRSVDRCVLANLPLVKQIAKKWASKAEKKGLTREDLIQEGIIGLMRAIEKFEPVRGHQFSTYAFYWIYMSVTRSISAYSLIHVPLDPSRKVSEDLENKVRQATSVISLNQTTGNNAHNNLSYEIQDTVSDSTVLTPDQVLAMKQDSRNLQAAMVQELNFREIEVLKMKYFEDLQLAEIGQKTSRTRERIRQIESGALVKLRDYMDREEANLEDVEE